MRHPSLIVLFLLALVTRPGRARRQRDMSSIWHGRIVETEQDRRPTDDTFGTFEYDAILDSLRRPGFVVLSEQRPPRTDSDSFANHRRGTGGQPHSERRIPGMRSR
mgnify:CR=1 FL=1